jgi:uncharacterized membrane protein
MPSAVHSRRGTLEPLQTTPVAPPPKATDSTPKLIYILYLASLVLGITSLVGVIMAYVNVGDAPEPARSHYRYQIRTFWIGLLYAVVGGLLTLIVIGFVVLLFLAVWLIVRCVKGLKYLDRGQPVPNPGTWLW